MKCLILYLVILFCSCANSPKQPEFTPATDSVANNIKQPISIVDTFSKYSYYLTGTIKGDTLGFGTAFLVRESNKLYLVSTAHNFTRWSSAKLGLRLEDIDTLHLRLISKENGNIDFFPIDIKKIKAVSKQYMFWIKPDVYYYPLPKNF